MISHNSTGFKYPDYISALPSDEFIKMAERKQSLFDQGISQVRANLDQYSALRSNIVTQVELDYFDKSMSNLVQEVNSNAGLDFAHKSNVDAVLGLGQYIEQDDNILSAISNGKEIQRRQTALKALPGEKRSAANDYFYMQDAQEYVQSGKLGSKISYGKEYVENYDLTGKYNEFMKTQKVIPSDTKFGTSQQFGDAYLLKRTEEGYSESDVAKRFRAFLGSDPKALRQLQIDTQYNLNLLGKEQAYVGYVEYNKDVLQSAQQSVEQHRQVLDRATKAYEVSPSPTTYTQLETAKQHVAYFEQIRVTAQSNASKPIESFNIQEYGAIYQDKFINNIGNMYAAKKVSEDLIGNKYWEEQQKTNRVYLNHRLALEKEEAKIKMERIEAYRGTSKSAEILMPELSTIVQTLGLQNSVAGANNGVIAEYGKQLERIYGDGGAAANIKQVAEAIEGITKVTGPAQLQLIRGLLTKQLRSGALNRDVKLQMSRLLGIGDGRDFRTFDQGIDAAVNQIDRILESVKTQKERAREMGDAAGTAIPMSFSNSFDYSLADFDQLDFLRNPNLSDRFAIANPQVGYSRKVGIDPITKLPIDQTSTTLKSDNKVNKGPARKEMDPNNYTED